MSDKEKKVVIIDNYDSFTFNLYQFYAQYANCTVYKNDELSINELKKKSFSHLIISPGPGHPDASALSVDAVLYFKDKIPVMGVCLGMQLIAYLNGASVVKKDPVHGRCEKIHHNNDGLHYGVPQDFCAARYNSLCVEDVDNSKLVVTATGSSGNIMGIKEKGAFFCEGVQYHPESFITDYGIVVLGNFLI